MTDILKVVSWGTIVAPLAFFYFYFVDWSIKAGAVPPSDSVGYVILVTMVLRLVVIMSSRRLRRGSAWVVVDTFALEVLLAAILLIAFVFTRTESYFALLSSVTLEWPTALLLVVPAFVLYRLAASMVERGRLSEVIPSATALFVIMLVPLQAAQSSFGPQTLSSISRLLLGVLIGLGRSEALIPEVTIAGLLLYLGLTLYVATTGEDRQGRAAALAVALGGSLVALAWSVVGGMLTNDLALLFVFPGAVILAVIWGSTRGD